jgi:flavin reductase (DIM6/NTAB) family NADH-FMN oxidoreductase RutF
MEKSSFKDAMAQIPTSVFVVAVKVEELVTACTISSVVSVDIERQTISFVLQKNSSTLKTIRSKKKFGISLLSDQQIGVSHHFSSLEKNFDQEKFVWDMQNEDFPTIPKCAGNFNCSLLETYELENTFIVLAKVEKFCVVAERNPLVYWNRKHFSLKIE